MPIIISVIVPVYNNAATLERCVRSIMTQDFVDFEIILVDDGSEDESFQIMQQLGKLDSRVVVMRQLHSGVSMARNMALDRAVGDFICFVDADDYLDSHHLSSMYAHSDCEMVVSAYIVDWLDSEDTFIRSEIQELPQTGIIDVSRGCDSVYSLFAKGRMHPCWNKLMRSDIIRKHNIRFPLVTINEDYLFVVKYLYHIQKIYAEPYAGYHWMRKQGKQTGVGSMPDNLLSIYLDAANQTKFLFQDKHLVDDFFYYSYELIARKYMNAMRSGVISRARCRKLLREMFSVPSVRVALREHRPETKGAFVQQFLLRFGLFYIYEKMFL